MNTTNATPAGTYYFRVIIDEVPSNVSTLTILAKTVTVGAASLTMAAGVANYEVTYPVTTQNIANGSYSVSVTNLPTGVSIYRPPLQIGFYVSISNNSGTLTLRGNGSLAVGNVSNLVLTLDGAQSNQFSLSIVTKTVTVGAASDEPVQGNNALITYPVTWVGISNTAAGTVQWYSDAAGTIPADPPANVITALGAGTTSRNLLVQTPGTTPPATYYFRLIIDGVPSNVRTFIVQRIIG